ncbi:MAG TPA: NADH-quinone oxidoreductase subunit H [Streptosporangiaceae bacterium]|nr:NADH-quinone oxidoreductase subunit H [Streptosporangiaceae bacterium]
MTVLAGASAVVQLGGGLAVSPLLPGLIQHWKARPQGRPGPSPLQPYRDLRRLWRKSAVSPAGATAVYRLAPAVTAAALICAIAIVPVTGVAPDLGVGHDVLALIGLLALARFAMTASAWDTASGFSLMGASRDLTISAFAEVALLLALAVAALVAGTTSLTGMLAGTVGGHPWSSPALPLGAAAFALVLVAETGRQPFDNPDTHLELTMIHEGPLLEYAGRDLAYLQWVSAARHWLLLILAAGLFLPHPHSAWEQLALLPAEVTALCGALALTETLVVKMRILLAPRLLGAAALVALLGVVARQAGIA